MKRLLPLAAFCVGCLWDASPAASADGCPAGSYSVTASGGGAFSALFDAFTTDRRTQISCSAVIATGQVAREGTFRVYSADYRGVVTLGRGDTARLVTQQGTRIDERRFGGPTDSDLGTRSFVGADERGDIRSTIVLGLTEASDPFAFGAVDTIDYALAASTTEHAIAASLDRLAEERTVSLLGLQSLSGLLIGTDEPFDTNTHIEAIGSLGSPLVGIHGQFGTDSGVMLNGGAAYFRQSIGETDAEGALMSASVRYLMPTNAAARPFGEAGGRVAPQHLSFARRYDADPSLIEADGSADGIVAGAFIRAGVVFDPNAANRFVLSSTYNSDWSRVDDYAEARREDNLFAASFDKADNRSDTVSASLAWTSHVTERLDISANIGVGYIFSGEHVSADIDFAGHVGVHADDIAFATYGAKLVCRPTPRLSASAFVQGVSTDAASVTPAYGATFGLAF